MHLIKNFFLSDLSNALRNSFFYSGSFSSIASAILNDGIVLPIYLYFSILQFLKELGTPFLLVGLQDKCTFVEHCRHTCFGPQMNSSFRICVP
jgi:hypothetical protein